MDATVVYNTLNRRAQRTPDISKLRELDNIPVFVYGTLKKGLGNHHYLTGDKFVSKAKLLTPWNYKMKTTGAYPVLLEHNEKSKTPDRTEIHGELYAVSPQTMISLDYLEGNGHLYQRRIEYVKYNDEDTDCDNRFKVVQAWVYVGIPTNFGAHLNGVCVYEDKEKRYVDWYPNEATRKRLNSS